MMKSEHISSYYVASVGTIPDHACLDSIIEADVCIVGGGYTGLSTAIELAEKNFRVVVLEANRIGWGASGRNGGQLCTGFASSVSHIEKVVGKEDARKLFQMTEESKSIIEKRTKTYGIDCDLAWGYLHAADRPREMRDIEGRAEKLAKEYGVKGLTVLHGNDRVREHVNSPIYIGGLHEKTAGHLHPLKYCLGLAKAAQTLGVQIFEQSPVTDITQGDTAEVKTDQGSVKAKFVVMACNAYLGSLLPKLRRKIMPVGTYIGATAPLGENRAKSLLPLNDAVADEKFVLDYYRLSSDHRMLFGGRVSYSTLMPPNLPRAMRTKMLRAFPDLEDTAFDYVWGGFVAITMERTPHIGRLGNNLYFAQGFSGQGVSLTAITGRILAESIKGQSDRMDLFTKLPHTTFPGGRLLRTPMLAMAMMWYRMQDLLP